MAAARTGRARGRHGDHHVRIIVSVPICRSSCSRQKLRAGLRERPAYGDGLGVRPFHYSTEHSSRPILFPSPCAGAHLVLLMSTLLEIRRWYLNFARHQVATSCSAMFRSPSHSQLQAASHCSANAHKSLTTQGAKNGQSPIYSRSMPARNGCVELTPENASANSLTRASPNTGQHISTSQATRSTSTFA